MSLINCFIVEDEVKSKEMLVSMIDLFLTDLSIVGTASSIKEALEKIPVTKFDILFLDINLPDGNGFNLLSHIKDINFQIVFTTAYDDHAIKAIKCSALDYLLKPIDVDELENTIERFKDKKTEFPNNKEIKEFANDITQNGKTNKIGLPSKNGILYINHEQIVRCEADSSYTIVHTNEPRKILVSKNLKQLEKMLSNHQFIRCHRKYLINKSHIKEYIRGNGGQVIMQDGSFALVSKRLKSSFLAQLEN